MSLHILKPPRFGGTLTEHKMQQGISKNNMSACMGIPFSEMDCDGFFPCGILYGYPLDIHRLSWENHFLKETVSIFMLNSTTLGVGEF